MSQSTRSAAQRAVEGNVILTPHAGEMASMIGADRASILRSPQAYAQQGAERWRAVVALKGARTYIATADGPAYCFSDGSVGLATSGSGDTLAGLVAGLVARGA